MKQINLFKKRNVILALLCISLLIVSGCGSNVAKDQEIKVGVILPLTGPVARWGSYMQESFDMAVEEVNEAGGVDGKQIKLIYEDTTCVDLKKAVSALQKIHQVDEVVAALGPYCGSTNTLAGQFSTDNNLFILSPGDNFGKTGDYKINTRYFIKTEAQLLAKYAIEQGWKNVAILHYNSDWGLGYKDGIEEYLNQRGGKLVKAESFTFDNIDVRTQLTKIKASNPDALVIIDGTGGELFRQAYELNLDIQLLSEWQIEEAFFNPGPDLPPLAGKEIEGVVYAFPGGETTEFHANFKEKYEKEPNLVHVDSYDAAMSMAKAIEECADTYDAACMTEYVSSLKNYPGAGGPISFNKETWSFDKTFTFRAIRNGKVVVLEE